MMRARVGLTIVGILLGVLSASTVHSQESSHIDRATRVLELLRQEQFDAVNKEFDAKLAALLPAERLRVTWGQLQQQAGAFKSIIERRTTNTTPGITGVVLGCQFEKAELNVMMGFDDQNKIAGLRFVPRPGPSTVATPPASSRFKEEAVTVGTGEWALPGTLSLPDGPIAGAVVLVHGSGPHDRDQTIGPNKPFQDLAWGLADRGIAVLRYEKRTRVHRSKLAGVKNFSVREETIEDAVLAAKLLRAHDRIDPKKVFVLGHSLGGMLAPRIAADDPSLAGLIIMAGAARPLTTIAREQLVYLASIQPGSPDPEETLKLMLGGLPPGYVKDLDEFNAPAAAAKLTMPMLILQGERDYQVTLEDVKNWRDALGSRSNVTIKTYPALNHLFLTGEGKATPADYERPGHIPDGVLDDIAGWIKGR